MHFWHRLQDLCGFCFSPIAGCVGFHIASPHPISYPSYVDVAVSQRVLPVCATREEMVADPAGADSAGTGGGADLRLEFRDRLADLSVHVIHGPDAAYPGDFRLLS